MDVRSLLPIIVAVLVGLVVLRVAIAAVRMSAKLMMWGALTAAVFGLGYLWYQNRDHLNPGELPILNIPAVERLVP